MDTLPVELMRLVFSHCDPKSVRNLREVTRLLADVGYEYLLSSHFTAVGWRNDIDRLHSIALHERLRGSITSICIFLGELSFYDAWSTSWFQHFVTPPAHRNEIMGSARQEFDKIERGRKAVGPLHLKADDLREACSNLPNLKEFEITFTQCPLNNELLKEVFDYPSCRKLDRPQTYSNLDAIISSLHGVPLTTFKVDRLPLEMFRSKDHRNHWFTHAQSFSSLETLNLTLDPSGLQGPGSAFRAVNGLGRILQLATNLRKLKLAFHPYSSENSKFALSFRELFYDFTYKQLTDLTLEGVSCEEEDLKYFLARHGATLVRLRLGGRGLAKPFEVSLGGIHMYEGTFKSLFTGLRAKVPKLERLHLEGIFECEHHDLPSHEAYNFYPLTNEDWEEVPRPKWVRSSRKTISCSPFEQYVLRGGPYPGTALAQQNY
ncbi:uncharacterized protein F4812DRAFT_59674 [Daldinia caldariorum]|uniref:uncharacterized protein n=1 Tax=Daldinia caldariorum TaxID=326644 RepID=UPI00200862C5|nr:uncharacterized protein F4812DRAFT_59674 [Daldinia caldariorum]KAI1466625.1 hypothetical protein F4812DRAFT_59674 [Daldinia caldariorum]